MKNLWRHVQFLPHGERLLTSSAAFWFFSARILVFAMAIAEAIAWSYLGYLFGDGWLRWLFASFTGATVFLVIWIIDVSLITLDRAWLEHSRRILGEESASRQSRRAREVFTFGLRICLLLASLTVTAPYLAQVVFYRDIQMHISQEATRALDDARHQLTGQYDALAISKDREIDAKRTNYENEVAGKGTSGRYGLGPAAQALGQTVQKLEDEHSDIIFQKKKALEKYDLLAKDWTVNRDQLAASYNVALPQSSILENRKALEELRKRPENRSTEFAIKTFLALIFCGLFLLKLFEPSSVRLYLSDVLQQEYGRYLSGTFDPLLPATEWSSNGRASMSPQRLYEFLVKVWAPVRALEEHERKTKARVRAAGQNLDFLESMRTKIVNEVTNANAEVMGLRTVHDGLHLRLVELHSAIGTLENDISLFRTRLKDVESKGLTDDSRIEYESHYVTKISKADRLLHELRDALPVETEKFKRADEALKVGESRLQEMESELEKTQRKIWDLRQMISDAAGKHANVILDGTNSE